MKLIYTAYIYPGTPNDGPTYNHLVESQMTQLMLELAVYWSLLQCIEFIKHSSEAFSGPLSGVFERLGSVGKVLSRISDRNVISSFVIFHADRLLPSKTVKNQRLSDFGNQ